VSRPPAHPAIDRFLADLVAREEIPGAAYAVGTRQGPVFQGTVGRLALEPREEPLPAEPVYDLASLTKPLATAALALRLTTRGRLALDAPVAEYLPAWSSPDRSRITCRDLLVHRSGLPAWEPLYLRCRGPGEVVDYLARRPLETAPGTRVLYSCLGYILLGRVLEAAAGGPLDRLVNGEVLQPLGLRWTRFRPPGSWRSRIAPTERGNQREFALAGEEGTGDPGWASGIIRGEVHDRNARFLEGIAGNAGLFGTAGEAGRLALAFLTPGLLEDAALREAATPHDPPESEIRTVGFQSARSPESAAGDALSPASFGHTGFTGTSVFIDPRAGRTFVLLTNRVHPVWRSAPMHPLRRAFHRVSVGALEERGL
jgi:CubicO group peptidase (beta-lactamase class C family)